MGLANNYLLNVGKVEEYFDAIRNAQAPERFTHKFLEGLGFGSSNDRLLIGMLKDLGFLDEDAIPQERYYQYLDRSRSEAVMAEALRETFADLFAVNANAQDLTAKQVENKLRTLYAGKKSDNTVNRIARSFDALTKIADFSTEPEAVEAKTEDAAEVPLRTDEPGRPPRPSGGKVSVDGLQYHINIVLPESRDQGVYDAIFRSLREHLS